jgi:hypothetical protein
MMTDILPDILSHIEKNRSQQIIEMVEESGIDVSTMKTKLRQKYPTSIKKTCQLIAQKGDFTFLRYAYRCGYPMTKQVCEILAKKGFLDCLKYAHENGCPWDSQTTYEAFVNCHYDCFMYALENGCPIGLNIIPIAIERNQFNYFKIIIEYTTQYQKDTMIFDCDCIVKPRDMSYFTYWFTNVYARHTLDSAEPFSVYKALVKYHFMEAYLYMIENDPFLRNDRHYRIDVYAYIASNDFEMFKIAHQEGIPVEDTYICQCASQKKEVIKYMIMNHLLMSNDICKRALYTYDTEYIEWLVEHGYRITQEEFDVFVRDFHDQPIDDFCRFIRELFHFE